VVSDDPARDVAPLRGMACPLSITGCSDSCREGPEVMPDSMEFYEHGIKVRITDIKRKLRKAYKCITIHSARG